MARTSGNLTERQLWAVIAAALHETHLHLPRIRASIMTGPATIQELCLRTGIDCDTIRACLCLLKHEGAVECVMVRMGAYTARKAYWRPKGWSEPEPREWRERVTQRDAEEMGMHVET